MFMQKKKMVLISIILLSVTVIASGCICCSPTGQKATVTATPQVIVVTVTPTATPLPNNGTVDITGTIPDKGYNTKSKIVQGYVYINGVPQQSMPVEVITTYKTIIPTNANGYFYYVAGQDNEKAGSTYTIAILDKNWNTIYEDNTPRPYDGKMLNISLTTT